MKVFVNFVSSTKLCLVCHVWSFTFYLVSIKKGLGLTSCWVSTSNL